ncbi:MAG: PAS domain S-box protein, partial [Caldiserica bacterium]|nr:PAS domain S-box protein [Caldisericota bacterium]
FGGDEFAILIENISENRDIISILTKIFNSFERPFILDKKTFEVKVNIGIAILPDDSRDLPDLIRKADIAMYNAKTKGPNTYEFYTREIEAKRKTVQEELKTREIQFQTIFEKAPLGITLIDINWKTFKVNSTLLKMLGYEKNEFLSNRLENFIIGDESREILDNVQKLKEGKIGGFTKDVKLLTKSEKFIWARILVSPVKDIEGRINFFICTVDDITEIRNAEIELEESKNILSKIIESSPIPIDVINSDHKITHWNSAMETLTGLRKEEVIGTDKQWVPCYAHKRPILADLLIDGVNEEKLFEIYGDKIKKSPLIASAYEGVDFFSTEKVKNKWFEFTAAPIKDSQGKIISALVTIIDVTDRVKNEKTLSSLYQILEAVFETKDLVELYESIHKTVQELMPAKN